MCFNDGIFISFMLFFYILAFLFEFWNQFTWNGDAKLLILIEVPAWEKFVCDFQVQHKKSVCDTSKYQYVQVTLSIFEVLDGPKWIGLLIRKACNKRDLFFIIILKELFLIEVAEFLVLFVHFLGLHLFFFRFSCSHYYDSGLDVVRFLRNSQCSSN